MTDQEPRKEVTPEQIAFALGGIALVAGGTRLLVPELIDSLGLAVWAILAGGAGGLLGYVGHQIFLRITGAAADAPVGRTKGDPQ